MITQEFKVVLLNENQSCGDINLSLLQYGFVTDFVPTSKQKKELLKAFNTPREITLFTMEERDNKNMFELFTKQILNYIETYQLGMPGLFNLETDSGDIIPVRFIHGASQTELSKLVQSKLYSNAPIKNVEDMANIVTTYNIDYDVNSIMNNELRIRLFDSKKDVFDDGDDAVRYICYNATGDTLLIKSKEVLEQIKESNLSSKFFEDHEFVLSQVFNRHKNIILSAKNSKNKTAINKIARLSKKNHVPNKEAINKKFINLALNDATFDCEKVLKNISIRDKFKYLNTLEFKKNHFSFDSYTVRNGKIFNKGDATIYKNDDIKRVQNYVLDSLKNDLAHLFDKTVVLDEKVDYGLPTSQKQTVGNLPFGTEISVPNNKKISAGIYWKNKWGASDLDLSAIDNAGNRVGWGQISGYAKSDIVYSGDMTNASRGAMESMTSSGRDYGLFVNIYSGNVGCNAQVVIGVPSKGKNKWMENAVVVEDITLNSRGSIIGFVKNKTFVVYSGRLNGKSSNFGERNAIIEKNAMNNWTIKKLFDALGIKYVTEHVGDADYDLSYSGITYDKFEKLFEKYE